MIPADQALRVVASAPNGKALTPTNLRDAAKEWEEEADRKRRIAVNRSEGSTRRKARVVAAATEAKERQDYARVMRLVAKEVERRGVRTVGEALRSKALRLALRALRWRPFARKPFGLFLESPIVRKRANAADADPTKPQRWVGP